MKRFVPYFILIFIVLGFFYKTILLGKLPFPGDLLLAEYNPWRHSSYDGYVPGSIPSKGQYFDVVRELYPWKTLVIDALKRGQIPLWNPYNFSGSPLLANYQSQVFYPPAIFYLILPQKIAWTILVILQPLLGSIFMYLFATEIGLSIFGAMISAILFNFSSFANVWMEFNTVWHTILWIPLLLYIVEHSIKQKKFLIRYQIIFIIALFSSITAGHPQDFINSFVFFLIYFFFRIISLPQTDINQKLKFFLSFAFTSGISFLLAAPQLLPTIELFKNSARVTHEYQNIITTMLVQIWQLPMLFIQDFFGNPATKSYFIHDTYVGKTLSVGVIGFLGVILSFFNRNKTWQYKFFLGLGLVILLLTVHTPLTEIFYRYPIPILSTGTPTRILFLLMFSLSVLAGFGFDAWHKNLAISRKSLILYVGILSSLWIFYFLKPSNLGIEFTPAALSTMKRALLLSSGIAFAGIISLFITGKIKHFSAIIIGLIIAELFIGFYKFNPFIPTSFIFPSNPVLTYLQGKHDINRFWGYGTAYIESNFSAQSQLFTAEGTDPLNLRWYNQFIQSSNDGNIAQTFSRSTRSDAGIASGYGEKELPNNSYRLKILDMLGVRYILDRAENPKDNTTFSPERFTPIQKIDEWMIYENKLAAPRFFLTGDIKTYSNTQEFEKKFFSSDFSPSQSVLLELADQDMIRDIQTTPNASVRLEKYSPNTIIFSVQTDQPQLLFLSDTYDPGWVAYNHNVKQKILKTNFAFRGVVVPAGSTRVEMKYEPKSFTYGVYGAIVGLLLILGRILYSLTLLRTHPVRNRLSR